MEIKDKVVIVTGASSGIGESVARKLAAKGAKLILAARNDEKLAGLAHELHGSVAVHTDMAQQADIMNLVARAREVDGRIDILINNAGVGMYGPFEDVNMDEYHHMMNVNVFGPVQLMKLVIPHMRAEGGGMILNVSSRVSKNYFPYLSAYASTKYALNAISLTARAELAKDNIIVSVMHPKMTATNFSANAMGQHPDYDAIRRARGGAEPAIDTADQVADRIIEQIGSEAAEAEM
jgi:short-subunit dehydrogenase